MNLGEVNWIGKDVLRWGPTPIRVFYTGDFLECIFDGKYFQKANPGIEWPRGLALYKLHKEKKFVWVQDFPEMRKYGLNAFLKKMLPEAERKIIYNKWLVDLNNLEKIEKEIDKTNLRALSEKELLSLSEKLRKAIEQFWIYVTVPELANYGSLPYLEEKLRKYISNEQEVHSAMEVLTAPENSSFYQLEEIDLVESKEIKEHAKKYFWIKNSYESVEIADEKFFEKRKKELSKNLRVIIGKKQEEVKKRKIELKKKYKLSDDIMKIAEAIVMGIEWQDTRKKDIWIYLHYKDLILKEVCRRYKLPFDDMLNFRQLEIQDFLRRKVDILKEIEKRKICFGIRCEDGKIILLDDETTLRYWDLYAEEEVSDKVDSVKGVVASKGNSKKLTGKVRIVLNPKKSTELKEGEILVTSMTTPEYIFLMKKASAIVTDAGGLTSHAAIVSRELGVPCIVGTKVATKVFKDGDMIEINSENGEVKLLKR
ncbi:MAG: PEP-utilizing enzyme [Nanoarchaeota archaeon]